MFHLLPVILVGFIVFGVFLPFLGGGPLKPPALIESVEAILILTHGICKNT